LGRGADRVKKEQLEGYLHSVGERAQFPRRFYLPLRNEKADNAEDHWSKNRLHLKHRVEHSNTQQADEA